MVTDYHTKDDCIDNQIDCILINPPIFYENTNSIWKQINSNFPPLGLASIAAYLLENNITVKIIDCNVVSPYVDEFEKYFIKNFSDKYKQISVIAITAMTCTIKKAYKIASICRKYYSDSLIVFGGVHPTFCYEEVLSNPDIDIVVIGEGEITLSEIIKKVDRHKINGIAYRSDNEKDGYTIVKTPARERIQNLDTLPIPAYHLLPIQHYIPAKGSYKRLPAMSMITSRGCPGKCTFCSKTLGNRLVFQSAERIFKEINYLINNYGIRQILFYDDTFTVWKENVQNLCQMLIDNKVDLTWTCFARVDYVDPELLKLMQKAGCHQIMYGVENINEVVLKNINKKIDINQIKNAVKWTKSAGIECRLAFMVGNLGDTREIIQENINFAIELDPDLIIVNITTPFPGTQMFQWAKERDLILTYNWDDYDLSRQIMKLPNMSVEETYQLYKLMYKKFYYRPKYLMKKIASIRNKEDVFILLDGLRALINFLKGNN